MSEVVTDKGSEDYYIRGYTDRYENCFLWYWSKTHRVTVTVTESGYHYPMDVNLQLIHWQTIEIHVGGLQWRLVQVKLF